MSVGIARPWPLGAPAWRHGRRHRARPAAKPRTTANRERAERRGRLGEALAALWLQIHGYRVLAHRVRMRSGEVDLLVRRGDLVAAVEVKTRACAVDGYGAVTCESRKRIAAAADAWLAARPGLRKLRRRFDLVVVAPWRLPVHVPDAW